jgi:hypothetical protein
VSSSKRAEIDDYITLEKKKIDKFFFDYRILDRVEDPRFCPEYFLLLQHVRLMIHLFLLQRFDLRFVLDHCNV